MPVGWHSMPLLSLPWVSWTTSVPDAIGSVVVFLRDVVDSKEKWKSYLSIDSVLPLFMPSDVGEVVE